ncbi:MAG: hypothetical protein H0T42_02025 [Deltaproteobacteria bacterium]|nr:hypothetical protein [Deltaproteobacteria bacterium]
MGSARAYVAEPLGTTFLLATVVGSGVMAQALWPQNLGVAQVPEHAVQARRVLAKVESARSLTGAVAADSRGGDVRAFVSR